VRRTQLYLEEHLWEALQVQSRQSGTTMSELVREAVRERYLGSPSRRREIFQAFAGSRKDRREFADSEKYVRNLRHGSRLDGLTAEPNSEPSAK
jgi:Ribbon-helix-helix protein, copG family